MIENIGQKIGTLHPLQMVSSEELRDEPNRCTAQPARTLLVPAGSWASSAARQSARLAGSGRDAWLGLAEMAKFSKLKFLQNFAIFWRAHSRLYQNEILQENMRLTAFFELYKMCTLLHRSKLKI